MPESKSRTFPLLSEASLLRSVFPVMFSLRQVLTFWALITLPHIYKSAYLINVSLSRLDASSRLGAVLSAFVNIACTHLAHAWLVHADNDWSPETKLSLQVWNGYYGLWSKTFGPNHCLSCTVVKNDCHRAIRDLREKNWDYGVRQGTKFIFSEARKSYLTLLSLKPGSH